MLAALDLFAGAGGFSLGLRKAGINVVGAIELDRFAAETYRTNFPGATVYEVALETRSSRWLKTKFSGVDIIAGGPPCQGFSVAGPVSIVSWTKELSRSRNGTRHQSHPPKFAVWKTSRAFCPEKSARRD